MKPRFEQAVLAVGDAILNPIRGNIYFADAVTSDKNETEQLAIDVARHTKAGKIGPYLAMACFLEDKITLEQVRTIIDEYDQSQ